MTLFKRSNLIRTIILATAFSWAISNCAQQAVLSHETGEQAKSNTHPSASQSFDSNRKQFEAVKTCVLESKYDFSLENHRITPKNASLSPASLAVCESMMKQTGCERISKHGQRVDFRTWQKQEPALVQEEAIVFSPSASKLEARSEPGIERQVSRLGKDWYLVKDRVDLKVYHLNR